MNENNIDTQIADAEAKLKELKKVKADQEVAARVAERLAQTTQAGEGLNFIAGVARIRSGNLLVQVHLGKNRWDRSETRKARVSVSGETDVDFSAAYEADRADGGPKPRGERPEVDRMFDALNREVVRNKKSLVVEAAAAVPELDELLAGVGLTFSRTAGCACGCSPAFVAAKHLSYEGRNVTDVFVTREASVAQG